MRPPGKAKDFSFRNSVIPAVDYIISQCIGVLRLSETWLYEMFPGGYEFNHNLHKSGRYGGGSGILFKSGLVVMVSKSETAEMYSHFENIDRIMNIGKVTG